MPDLSIKEIRRRLLKEYGLVTTQPKARHKRRLSPLTTPTASGKSKTPLMQMLEMRYGRGQNIWEILQSGSLSTIRKRLGNEVDVSTISKWIKRYKLRYTKDNLPSCELCQYYKPWCDMGACNLLMELELWDLVIIKKEEVLSHVRTQATNQAT